MSLVRLIIKGISYSQTQNGAYALILSELKGERKLPIVIGAFEAQSIAIALEKEIKPPRPLTHDLFKNFSIRFDIIIKQIIIHKLVDGVFYSSIICERDRIEEIIDSRTSDAIAIALRFNAPIFTYENILTKAGVILKVDEVNEDSESIIKEIIHEEATDSNDDYKNKNTEELQKLLKIAVLKENYENAALIRDEISKRQ
ncbi:MAG: bifunctional DNase/RNase [Flavobacteriaceae bacterium]|jgi:bifunctional DNase/RNase|tara:strand:+ start:810 stop:1409 length:600 start_codon:yes stop_codon:yes gene_type:complete